MGPSRMLERHLAREQRAFLRRPRSAWGPHLEHMRRVLGEALGAADPARPVLVLGAGFGLEVPWREAPPLAQGWDADPWSRTATFLRHGRWVPWHFGDVTDAFGPLEALLRRNIRRDWRGRSQGHPDVARARVAGLLESLDPRPERLEATLRSLGPSLVVAANLMGQFGVVAEALVEQAFGGAPWQEDPDQGDPLAEALDRWTARVVVAFLAALRESGAALALVHDRAVLEQPVGLGPWSDDWRVQLRSEDPVTARDSLCGVDVLSVMGRAPQRAERWLWPVGPGQVHLVEALGFRGT